MSEETTGADNHELASTTVQVHLAVKVRIVADAPTVDYLVTAALCCQQWLSPVLGLWRRKKGLLLSHLVVKTITTST